MAYDSEANMGMNDTSKRPLRGLRAFMALPEEAEVPVLSRPQSEPVAPEPATSQVPPDAPPGPLLTGTVMPAPGQRWAYGARKQELAARRSWREADRARTPLQRFEAVLAQLPGRERPVLNIDLVEATLAASAANTVRGLLADMRGFGDACRARGVSALPAQPASVIAFLRDRADGVGGKSARPATLSRILWAIGTFHRLFGLEDPTRNDLVRLEMKALRRRLGTAQKQARPLRYKGAVSDVFGAQSRGVSLKALLEACGSDEKGIRDRALLSVAYDTGLRASELVAICFEHILPASDPDTRLLVIPRHKGDQEGEGATAFLSMRSVLALQAWAKVKDELGVPGEQGAVFRRLFIKMRKPADPAKLRADARRRAAATYLGLPGLMLDEGSSKRAGAGPLKVVTLGQEPLRPQAVTQIFKARAQEAWDKGLIPDLTAEEFAQWHKGISAHSTRIGMNNDLFAAGEDIAGIMDALRWKSPKMPLLYNRNLAAEHGAAGRLLTRMK